MCRACGEFSFIYVLVKIVYVERIDSEKIPILGRINAIHYCTHTPKAPNNVCVKYNIIEIYSLFKPSDQAHFVNYLFDAVSSGLDVLLLPLLLLLFYLIVIDVCSFELFRFVSKTSSLECFMHRLVGCTVASR